MSTIPDGLTDDMSIHLPPGRTVEEITDFVIDTALANVMGVELVRAVESTFGISTEDAELVCDRVFGGIVRASTGNIANRRPDAGKDPFAFSSYERANRDPEIIESLHTKRAPKKKRSWWQFWK